MGVGRCVDHDLILPCSSSQYFDVKTLSCVASCAVEDDIVIIPNQPSLMTVLKYCRCKNNIFI